MSHAAAAAWALTRAISPRDDVRIAVLEHHGGSYSNAYTATAAIDGDRPDGPWAMYLADRTGYRFICFDFDAKAGNAGYDAGRLSSWLDELNIDHLVVVSGPTGGRHVWIALDEAVEPELVRDLAERARSLLRSVDTSPLTNPHTGCVRPPGAPHRAGGASTVHRGRVDVLTAATTTVDDLARLRSLLTELGGEAEIPAVSIIRGMARDEHGHPHLIGTRREPSARIRALLTAPAATDTSTTQAAVLAGLARARWRYADVAALLADSPALEHARSRPGATGRIPVPLDVARRRLAADWTRAVYYVAANPIAGGDVDEDFQTRSLAVARAVRAAEEKADTMPGRWGLDGPSRVARARRGRHSHRAVLRAVSLYMVQAARHEVEVDIRRLSADTGYGREACRLALIALSTPEQQTDPESAWLVKVADADGVHGARYRLSDRFSTEADTPKWSQAATRPAATAGSDARAYWIHRLASSLHALAHDVFAAPHSLGRAAGRIYAALAPDAVLTAVEVAGTAGSDVRQARTSLRRLARYGLAVRSAGGWTRTGVDRRDEVATALEVDGYLLERAARYDVERGTWAWWQAELTWMRRRHKRRRGRRTPTGVALFAQNDRPDYPSYPRSGPRRFDHAAARALVRDGILRPAIATTSAA